MKINSLGLRNFKGIEKMDLDFDGKCVVFFGINGVGKSSILRAINLIYSNIINKVVNSRFKQGINLELNDICYGTSECSIALEISICDKLITYARLMQRQGKSRTHFKAALDQIYDCFLTFLKDDNSNMPIYVNYGVNRGVFDIPLRIVTKHSFDKLCAFEKAIENRIDFRTFFEWFRNQEDYENQVIAHENRKYVDKKIDCVRRAILVMLDDFTNLRIARDPLRMVVRKGKKNLRVDQLSDGEKCTLAMIGDLARRLAIANPSLDNPLLGQGIVLIDEIELHMHPIWQRRIINTLRSVFPNIQFIISTHSPQVLGEIGEDINIFLLKQSNGKVEYTKIGSLVDWDANYILEEFMGTSSLNLDAKGRIARMYELINEKKYDEAQKYVETLEKATDSAHQDVVRAKILISRGLAKK